MLMAGELSPSISSSAFRTSVGEFATGVTVVTAAVGDRLAGMTLNSFTSVSLDPLLVLVSLAHGSRTLDVVLKGRTFAVSMLRRWQRDVAERFARRAADFPRYLVEERDGFLFVTDALVHLGCHVIQIVSAGDHDLVIGEVVTMNHRSGDPLIFHRGRLGGLAIDAHVAADSIGSWDLDV
jgi:flavin reductase (DIM6/NTAB) family NADH-FMN oxidoreductase RutF